MRSLPRPCYMIAQRSVFQNASNLASTGAKKKSYVISREAPNHVKKRSIEHNIELCTDYRLVDSRSYKLVPPPRLCWHLARLDHRAWDNG